MEITELTAAAIDDCAREPIHIPGHIQPQGFLLALAEPGHAITHASANIEHYIGLPATAVLGADGFSLLEDAQTLRAAAQALDEADQPIPVGVVRFRDDAAATPFDLVMHRRGGAIIAEFEPVADVAATLAAMYPVVDAFVTRLQQADTIEAVCALAVGEMHRLTRYGRVLAYAFDADGHGNVVAEVAEPDYDAYQGLRFPASDIPEQARALYRLNRIRTIPDANYTPVPILAADAGGEPLDLSLAHLRSVSPVHVQYMKNMRTLASMSVSIVVKGRLWGLISCHDVEPKPVPRQTRAACELLGKIVSLQVEAREAQAETERLLQLRRMLVNLLSAMADRDDVATGLVDAGPTLLAFGRAAGAAIVVGERCTTVGEVPDGDTIQALTRWLDQRAERELFHTDALGSLDPQFAQLAPTASGLLALSISELYPNYILWFRPELVRTVKWAGQPEELAARECDTAVKLTPRQSFASWAEIVRGQSLPWEWAELEAAIELRAAVLGIVLRQAEELAELADELRRSNSELESFSYSVSHDLRAPLRHIAGYAELLSEDAGGVLSERAHRYLGHIGESARFAGTLVDDLLSFSQMGRSALRLTQVDLVALVSHVRDELAPDLQGRAIEWVVQPLPKVQGDVAFLHLALRNLLTNAIKYTGTRAQARIEIGARTDAREHVVFIRDNGVGFDMQYVDKLFGVFQRLHRMEEFEGTGIGLANVRRIVERHGGRVWAEGIKDEGATFYFALPRVIPDDMAKRRFSTPRGKTDA